MKQYRINPQIILLNAQWNFFLLPAQEYLHRHCAVTLCPECPIALRSSTEESEIMNTGLVNSLGLLK